VAVEVAPVNVMSMPFLNAFVVGVIVNKAVEVGVAVPIPILVPAL